MITKDFQKLTANLIVNGSIQIEVIMYSVIFIVLINGIALLRFKLMAFKLTKIMQIKCLLFFKKI